MERAEGVLALVGVGKVVLVGVAKGKGNLVSSLLLVELVVQSLETDFRPEFSELDGEMGNGFGMDVDKSSGESSALEFKFAWSISLLNRVCRK